LPAQKGVIYKKINVIKPLWRHARGTPFLPFAFSLRGDVAMNQRDLDLLDKQLGRLNPPRKDGVVGLTVVLVFFIGLALGGVLFTHEGAPRSTANDIAATSFLADGPPVSSE
jgi:hypothetical protein